MATVVFINRLHRQGGFSDPFGHLWPVGDKSPLTRLARRVGRP